MESFCFRFFWRIIHICSQFFMKILILKQAVSYSFHSVQIYLSASFAIVYSLELWKKYKFYTCNYRATMVLTQKWVDYYFIHKVIWLFQWVDNRSMVHQCVTDYSDFHEQHSSSFEFRNFPSPRLVASLKQKETILPNYSTYNLGRKDELMLFLKAGAWSESQITSFNI